MVELSDTTHPDSAGILWPTIVAWLVPFTIVLVLSAIAIFGFHSHDIMLPAHVAFGILVFVGGIASSLIAIGAWLVLKIMSPVAAYHARRLCMDVAVIAFLALIGLWALHFVMNESQTIGDYVALGASLLLVSLLAHYVTLNVLVAKGHLHLAQSNLCSGCGYPIGTSAKCSECGAAVRRAP